MAYGLPSRGQLDWDDELNNSIEAIRSDASSALSNALVGRAESAEAKVLAQEALARALEGTPDIPGSTGGGDVFVARYNAGWPARPTSDATRTVLWVGGTPETPPTNHVSGVDLWYVPNPQ